MSVEIPQIQPRVDQDGRLRPAAPEGWRFGHEQWISTLQSIWTAETIGQQRSAIRAGTLLVAAHMGRLYQFKHDRLAAGHTGSLVHASFRFDDQSKGIVGDLAFVRCRTERIEVAYPKPEPRSRNALAVFDRKLPAHQEHEVFYDESERLTALAASLGEAVVGGLTESLDYWYPGFELPEKIANLRDS